MKTKTLMIAVVVAALSLTPSVWAASGIFNSFVIIDEAGNVYFDLDSATGNTDFDGHTFGTKTWGTDTLDIEGGEIQTYKNGGSNVTGAEVQYRVYKNGDTPGAFSIINLPYDSELGGGDQKWDETAANTSLMNVQFINRASYTIEVFGKAFSSDGDHFASNGGANHKASFEPAGAREEQTIASGSTDQSSIGDISGGIDASGDLVKKGAGELILDVANPDFDSIAYIDAGTLSVEHANGWQSAGTVNVGAVAGADDATFSIADTDGGYTFSDAVVTRTGTGARTVGAINTSNINTYSGSVTINAATRLSVAAGGTLDFTGDISGSTAVTVTGGGTVQFENAKTLTSDITLEANTDLRLNTANILPDTVDIIVNAGSTLDLNGNNETIEAVYGGGDVALGAGQLIVDHTTTRTLSGVMSGTGTFVKKGSGILTFDGANSYSGETFPVGGTLQIGATPDAGFTGTVRLGETFGIDAAIFGISAGGVDVSNDIVVRSGSSGTLTIAANNTTGVATFSGDITLSNNVEVVVVSGTGTAVLGGAVNLLSNTLYVKNFNDTTIGAVTGTGDLDKVANHGGALIINGDVNVGNVFHNDGTIRIVAGGDITGGLYYLGSDFLVYDTTLELAAAGLDIDRTIEVEDSGFAETRTISMTAVGSSTLSGTVQLDNERLVTSASAGGTLVLGGTVDLDFDGNNTLTVQGAGDTTITGQLNAATGASLLDMEGSGTVQLAGDNSLQAFKILLDSGTLYLNHANALGTAYADKIEVNGNSTLRVGQTMSPASLGIQYEAASSLTLNVDNGVTFTVPGAVDDQSFTGNLTKVGDGTALLNGANNIDGTTLVAAGTLGGTGSISGALDVDGGGTVSPGASVGTFSAGATTWNTNGIYVWEVNDFAGTYGADPGWDKLDITGDLNIDATAAKPFTIKITSLNGSVAGNAANFNSSNGYTQSIASVSASINGFVANKFTLDSSGFSNNEDGGTWSIEQGSGTIDLVFSVGIPAPATALTVYLFK